MPKIANVKRNLVADDEPQIVRLIERQLAGQGYEVTAVYDGRTAIEALQKTTFSHAILDLMMPFADGTEVLEWIRTHDETKGMWVAIMSAQAKAVSRLEWPYTPIFGCKSRLALRIFPKFNSALKKNSCGTRV